MKNLVQAIAVVPGTHFETIAAVATASAIAACQRRGDPEDWQAWFGQSFTKTVRRAKRPSQIGPLEADPLVVERFEVGGARAFAYAPMDYCEFPAHLRRLQVAGLDIDRSLDSDQNYWRSGHGPHSAQLDPTVVINESVSMSTGKSAAQVAHALVAWTQALPGPARIKWMTSPALNLLVGDLDSVPKEHSITIRDNGLTEINPGTATVRIALG